MNIDNRDINSLQDVLEVFKDSIFQSLCVASLAYYDSILQAYNGTYSIVKVKPFPLADGQTEHIDYAYCFSNDTFSDKEIVLIIYTDKNFISSINISSKAIGSVGDSNHSTNNAILIKLQQSSSENGNT